ncbi:acyl thioesterase [Fusarium tjaetaba]|uniref:Acyl thioesterase n=1 Tax=Fusarium tjaetaba TaxID=1567544 RepID=A0A8H5VPF2_9HYPO|nr:acyl thioesterase [Fusarium tjaetaba]KAF5629795.1 acyl thioesterase [Fusarium tjaetaba]
MSLAVLLSLDHSICGCIGISSFLTYRDDLKSVVSDEVDSDNPFSHPSEPQDTTVDASAVKAQELERDFLDLDPLDRPSQEKTAYQTPIFLRYWKADEKVPCALGERAAQSLQMQGIRMNGSAMKTKVTGKRSLIR